MRKFSALQYENSELFDELQKSKQKNLELSTLKNDLTDKLKNLSLDIDVLWKQQEEFIDAMQRLTDLQRNQRDTPETAPNSFTYVEDVLDFIQTQQHEMFHILQEVKSRNIEKGAVLKLVFKEDADFQNLLKEFDANHQGFKQSFEQLLDDKIFELTEWKQHEKDELVDSSNSLNALVKALQEELRSYYEADFHVDRQDPEKSSRIEHLLDWSHLDPNYNSINHPQLPMFEDLPSDYRKLKDIVNYVWNLNSELTKENWRLEEELRNFATNPEYSRDCASSSCCNESVPSRHKCDSTLTPTYPSDGDSSATADQSYDQTYMGMKRPEYFQEPQNLAVTYAPSGASSSCCHEGFYSRHRTESMTTTCPNDGDSSATSVDRCVDQSGVEIFLRSPNPKRLGEPPIRNAPEFPMLEESPSKYISLSEHLKRHNSFLEIRNDDDSVQPSDDSLSEESGRTSSQSRGLSERQVQTHDVLPHHWPDLLAPRPHSVPPTDFGQHHLHLRRIEMFHQSSPPSQDNSPKSLYLNDGAHDKNARAKVAPQVRFRTC